MNRRVFLGSATLLTACAAGRPLMAAADAAAAAPIRASRLSRTTFTPLLGRTSTASGPGVRARLTLVAIGDVLGAPAGSEDSFLLQFVSPNALPDGVYTLTGAGQRALFLCAVYGRPERRYEAVVNQLAPEPAAAQH